MIGPLVTGTVGNQERDENIRNGSLDVPKKVFNNIGIDDASHDVSLQKEEEMYYERTKVLESTWNVSSPKVLLVVKRRK